MARANELASKTTGGKPPREEFSRKAARKAAPKKSSRDNASSDPVCVGNLFFEDGRGLMGTSGDTAVKVAVQEGEFDPALVGFVKCCGGALVSEAVVQAVTDAKWTAEHVHGDEEQDENDEEESSDCTEVFEVKWDPEDGEGMFRIYSGT